NLRHRTPLLRLRRQRAALAALPLSLGWTGYAICLPNATAAKCDHPRSVALRPCTRCCFEQTVGPERQATNEDKHDDSEQCVLDLPLGRAGMVAGMRLDVPKRHAGILLQGRRRCRQQASQLILRGTHLLATEVERVVASSSRDEVQIPAHPGNFNLLEVQWGIVTVEDFEAQVRSRCVLHTQGRVGARHTGEFVYY